METKEALEAINKELQQKFDEVGNRIEEKASSADLVKATAELEDLKAKQKAFSMQLASAASAEEKGISDGDQRVRNFLVKADKSGMTEIKTVYIGDDTNAGYLVRPQIEAMIATYAQEASPFASQAEVITITSDQMERISNDTATAAANTNWGTELNSGTAQTNLSLSVQNIPVHDLYSKAYVTRNMLADGPMVEGMIAEQVGYGFTNARNAAFFNGDGVGKPLGFLKYVNEINGVQIETGSSEAAAGLTVDGLSKLVGLMKPTYLPGSAWWMNRTTLYSHLLLLEDEELRKYLMPDLRADVAFTFMGYPIIVDPNMPDVAAAANPILFGNVRQGYTVVERAGMSVMIDPYTVSPQVKYEWHQRVGGDVKVAEAMKLLTIEA